MIMNIKLSNKRAIIWDKREKIKKWETKSSNYIFLLKSMKHQLVGREWFWWCLLI